MDIEVKAAEFKYNKGLVCCLVCEFKFKYGTDQPREYGPRDVQSQQFRNLKKALNINSLLKKLMERSPTDLANILYTGASVQQAL